MCVKKMRPPPYRNFVGVVVQPRPKLGNGPPQGPSPAPRSVYASKENEMTPFDYNLHRNHGKNVRPLRSVDRYRGYTGVDFSKNAPIHTKMPRHDPPLFNIPAKDRPLVYSFE